LNLVGDEFWVVGPKGSRSSEDGLNWRDLPGDIPSGQIIASPEGTLINIDRTRTTILRSTDRGHSWKEVFSYEEPKSPHIHGAQGLRDIAFGLVRK
jgi:hypothetical protein